MCWVWAAGKLCQLFKDFASSEWPFQRVELESSSFLCIEGGGISLHLLRDRFVLCERKLRPGISLDEVLCLSRDEVEENLEFTAFILFRNELKTDSQEAIEEIKAGEVK